MIKNHLLLLLIGTISCNKVCYEALGLYMPMPPNYQSKQAMTPTNENHISQNGCDHLNLINNCSGISDHGNENCFPNTYPTLKSNNSSIMNVNKEINAAKLSNSALKKNSKIENPPLSLSPFSDRYISSNNNRKPPNAAEENISSYQLHYQKNAFINQLQSAILSSLEEPLYFWSCMATQLVLLILWLFYLESVIKRKWQQISKKCIHWATTIKQ